MYQNQRRKAARRLAENLAKGNRQDTLVEQYPEIAQAYETYNLCKSVQMVTHETSKGGKQYTRTEPFTVGFLVLPEKGGVLDQPQRLMTFFQEFIHGERRSFGT